VVSKVEKTHTLVEHQYNGDAPATNCYEDDLLNSNGDKLISNGDKLVSKHGDVLPSPLSKDKSSNNNVVNTSYEISNGIEVEEEHLCNGDVVNGDTSYDGEVANYNGDQLPNNCNEAAIMTQSCNGDKLSGSSSSYNGVQSSVDDDNEEPVSDNIANVTFHVSGSNIIGENDDGVVLESQQTPLCVEEKVIKPESPQKHKKQEFPVRDITEVDKLRKIYEQRPYQNEIVERALKENTIVCLGTGTGKTFISASVIKEMQGGIKGT